MAMGSRRSGRPRTLTEDGIAAAVLEHGFMDLRVSDIAAQLGVNTATLYRYVSSQSELATLGINKLFEEHAWPVLHGDEWRAYLTGLADGVYALAVQHPGLAMFSALALVPSAATVQLYNKTAADLVSLGWPIRLATHAVSLCMNVVLDARRFADSAVYESEGRSDAGLALRRVDPPFGPVFAESMEPGSPEWYADELRIVLAGLASALEGDQLEPGILT